MDTLQKQEKQQEIQKLQKLLRSVSRESKKEHEWQVLENTILAQLDDLKKRAPSPKVTVFAPITRFFPGSVPAFAAAAGLLIICIAGIFTISYRATHPKPLAGSRILGVQGAVTLKNISTDQTEPAGETSMTQQAPILFSRQELTTADNGSLMVQIDKGSSLLLSENSRLVAGTVNDRKIDLFLDQGTILATVSKRGKNQSFIIRTPDAVCTVVGTIFSVTSRRGKDNTSITSLTVIEGAVEIQGKSDPALNGLVKSGETVSLQSSALSRPKQISDDQLNIRSITLLKLAQQMSNEKTANAGLLDISSNPAGAKIFIQDVFVGNTPMAFKYPNGSYSLKLALDGYAPWQREIIVQRLNTSFISAEFEKEESAVSSEPAVAKKAIRRKNKERIVQTQTVAAEQKTDSPDEPPFIGILLNPLYVEALIQINIGEYRKALIILDSLKELAEITIPEKLKIMSKIAECYRGMGNFHNTLKNLTERYDNSKSRHEKSNMLWEIITVKANCLQDYEGAEKAISTYILLYPDGAWIESAYAKLGELQYITGKLSKAIGTFQYHINFFKSSKQVENSIYLLGNILRTEIREYLLAVSWYTRLIKEFPSSKYLGNALFERAECYEALGQNAKAKKDYQKYLKLFPEGHYKTLCLTRLSVSEE